MPTRFHESMLGGGFMLNSLDYLQSKGMEIQKQAI